jgi:hypothetical protein
MPKMTTARKFRAVSFYHEWLCKIVTNQLLNRVLRFSRPHLVFDFGTPTAARLDDALATGFFNFFLGGGAEAVGVNFQFVG